MAQLHNKFTDTQVRELIEWYLAKKKGRKYVQEILEIKKTVFFALVQKMREHLDKFSILHTRNTPTCKIPKEAEGYIAKKLEKEKELIENKGIFQSSITTTLISKIYWNVIMARRYL